MSELDKFLATYSLRRRADRIVTRFAKHISDIDYAFTPDEIIALATTTTVEPCYPL